MKALKKIKKALDLGAKFHWLKYFLIDVYDYTAFLRLVMWITVSCALMAYYLGKIYTLGACA